MMSTRRAGFTLVEMLIVTVLGTIILGAAYQSLMIQERSYRIASNAVVDHDALRTALGVLESELREVSTAGGVAGMSDIVRAESDEIVVRAARGIAFVCERHPSDRKMHTWSASTTGQVRAGDAIVVFADGMTTTDLDDAWLTARAKSVGTSSVACASRPAGHGGPGPQLVELETIPGGMNVDGNFLVPVVAGAPVRAMTEVTYGLYEFGGEWGLGRAAGAGAVEPIIVGLAEPSQGLVFTYLDANGSPIASNPVMDPSAIAAIDISARTQSRAGNPPIDMQTRIFLRNN